MGEAIPPSAATVIAEDKAYLSFPAIARAGNRLVVIFRQGKGNPTDLDARILWIYSEDNGRTWSDPEVWVDMPSGDCRNCGGGTLSDGIASFVYDVDYEDNIRGRQTFFRETIDGITWDESVRLHADWPDYKHTSVVNRAVELDKDRLCFFHFHCDSVIVDRRTGAQTRRPMVPRQEPGIAMNRSRELVSYCKGGDIDISSDEGRTWWAAGRLTCISQPDLIQLADGHLLFASDGYMRECQWLLLSADGRDTYERRQKLTHIFRGSIDGDLTNRGKIQCHQEGDEILSVVYEAFGNTRTTSRVYLIRTPIASLDPLD